MKPIDYYRLKKLPKCDHCIFPDGRIGDGTGVIFCGHPSVEFTTTNHLPGLLMENPNNEPCTPVDWAECPLNEAAWQTVKLP